MSECQYLALLIIVPALINCLLVYIDECGQYGRNNKDKLAVSLFCSVPGISLLVMLFAWWNSNELNWNKLKTPATNFVYMLPLLSLLGLYFL